MIDKQTNSAKYSDETIRSFLLGQLAADNQTFFEQRLFTDDDFESRVRLAELALTDDYARDRLSRQERDRFHKTYLVTTERKQIIGVSQALHDRFRSPNIARISLTQRLRAAFDVSQPAWRYAFAALILLLVFATVWRGIKEPQIVQQIIPKPVTPKPTATPAPTRKGARTARESIGDHRSRRPRTIQSEDGPAARRVAPACREQLVAGENPLVVASPWQ